MNKRPFWKQANRGFLFSLVLLAAVLVYVLITQLMLIPERNSIRQLAGIYLSMSEQTSALSDEKIDQLKNEDALNQEAERLKKELSKYFIKDSAYIDGAVQPLLIISSGRSAAASGLRSLAMAEKATNQF